MTIQRHYVSVGDTLTPMAVQLVRKSPTGLYVAVNLTGLTVKFTLVDEAGTVVVTETNTGVMVTDDVNGKVTYDFSSADVDEGIYYGWFRAYSGTEYDTFPVGGRQLEIIVNKVG
jgi:hypothetical protein